MTKISKEEYETLKGLDDQWKWIARDYKGRVGGNLFAYSEKPYKDYHKKDWGDGSVKWLSIGNHLFQSIQWQDEEPCEIAELIGEYESEETEANKQKLIEKWESAIESAEFYGKGKEEELISYMKDFVSDLNQLDEPEATLDRAFEKVAESYPMTKEEIWRHLERLVAYGGKVTYGDFEEPEVLSQEWIDDNAYAVAYDGMPDQTEVVYVDDLQNLLVPKHEEMKVPEMWHDVIVQNKEDGHSLRWTLNYIDNLNVNDVDSFAKAWIAYPNIEVEEEQKYYVLNKTRNSAILVRMFDEPTLDPAPITEIDEEDQFTEQEIKEYDERFWPFAVKVEEMEE